MFFFFREEKISKRKGLFIAVKERFSIPLLKRLLNSTLQSFKDDVLDELFHFLNKQLDSSLRGMFNEKTNLFVSLH